MKTAFLILGMAVCLMGCASEESKQTTQQPKFGQPVSTIPWNQPQDWENAGQLGSMPGFSGNGR
jgi:hypothetical protein